MDILFAFLETVKHIEHQQNDSYRSLSGELRHAGGFAKNGAPFSEFLWVDSFRSRIALDQLGGFPRHDLKL